MKIKISMLTGVAALSLLLGTGCVQHRVVYVQQPAPPPSAVSGTIIVTAKPPPPRVEIVGAAPGPNHVWVPGCWEWRGNWFWVGGRWTVGPHPQAHWVPGRWTRRSHDYIWIQGYWR